MACSHNLTALSSRSKTVQALKVFSGDRSKLSEWNDGLLNALARLIIWNRKAFDIFGAKFETTDGATPDPSEDGDKIRSSSGRLTAAGLLA